MTRFALFAPVLALVSLVTCGRGSDERPCTDSSECIKGGEPGQCLPSPESSQSWCAFDDGACNSRLRWGPLTGDGLADECVDETDVAPDAGVDAGAVCDPPGSFLRCDGDTKIECSAAGTEVSVLCELGCVEAAGRCNECAPGTTTCSDDQLVQCDADGLVAQQTACPLGCHGVEVRCNALSPANGLATYLDLTPDADDVVLSDGARFDTDTGEVTDGDASPVLIPSFFVAAPTDGVNIRVFVVRSIALANTTFEGTAAVAIVSHEPIAISGDLRFGNLRPGAFTVGACIGQSGDTTTVGSATHTSGGGGGGSREDGAQGGTIEFAVAGGAGGVAFPNPGLEPLRGGCRGGGTSGGRGGGAIQLVSSTAIQFAASSSINAGGQGGQAEDSAGGSGGGILLEAPAVSLDSLAVLAANGGGGSCPQQPGQDGLASTTPAAGGSCPDSSYTDGGDGGAGASSPLPGETMTASSTVDFVAGSGGASAGYIRINTRTGAFDSSSDAVVSPEAATGTVTLR